MKKIVLGILFLCCMYIHTLVAFNSQLEDFPFGGFIRHGAFILFDINYHHCSDGICYNCLSIIGICIEYIFNSFVVTTFFWFFIWYFYPFFKRGWFFAIKKRKEMIN